ncbi:MAG: hypothetical protein JKY92_02780 [Magnetovibrio sp.]|nr:hypothetical protein [Magnetovibrio sp.]
MKSWFVVRSKTGAESRVEWHLNNQGFDVYLPQYQKEIRHARKTQIVLRPVFPGYLFVSLDVEQQRWRAINGTMGVIGLVQFGERPSAVSDDVVNILRSKEVGGLVNIAPNGLKKGDIVRLREGAFADHNALLEELSDAKRVILLLDLMGRKVRVSASMETLAKVS